MNEQIKELAKQAGFSIVETQGTVETTLWSFDDEPIDDELQKFAKSIIQECIEIVLESDPSPKMSLQEPYATIMFNIKDHFGIE